MASRPLTPDRKSKHLLIADYLRQQIEKEKLPPRHMLESEAELCERFNVSRGPVRQALLRLEQEGLIYRVSVRGTFVAAETPSAAPPVATPPLTLTSGGAAAEPLQPPQQPQHHPTRFWVFPMGNSSATSDMLEGLLRGIDEKAAEHGVALTVGALSTAGGIRSLMERGSVAGIFTFAMDTTCLDDPTFDSVPKIWLMSRRRQWQTNWEQQCDIAGSDNEAIGGMAARYLIDRGHRDLAFVNLAVDDPSASGRLPGFLFTGHSLGARVALVDDAGLQHGEAYPLSLSVAQDVVDRLLALTPRPTGIFIPSDKMTSIIQPMLQKRGIKVGEEMLIISCNNYQSVLAGLDPRPATIDMDCEEIGRRAGDLMALRMRCDCRLPWVNIVAPPKLVLPPGSA